MIHRFAHLDHEVTIHIGKTRATISFDADELPVTLLTFNCNLEQAKLKALDFVETFVKR